MWSILLPDDEFIKFESLHFYIFLIASTMFSMRWDRAWVFQNLMIIRLLIRWRNIVIPNDNIEAPDDNSEFSLEIYTGFLFTWFEPIHIPVLVLLLIAYMKTAPLFLLWAFVLCSLHHLALQYSSIELKLKI